LGSEVRIGRPGHGLRIRLTLSYVLLFAIVLAAIGIIVRQLLTTMASQQAQRVLTEEWGTLLAYLRIENGKVAWSYDPQDGEQALAVRRLQRVLLIADRKGEPILVTGGLKALLSESPIVFREALQAQQPRFLTRTEPDGDEYLIRIGRHRWGGSDFVVAMGLPMTDSGNMPAVFTKVYFSASPILLLGIGLIGWFTARRALEPLNRMAETARSVSEGTLGLRIIPLKSEDEVGHLVVTFNRMMDRLEASFNQIRQFTIDASHELRTPLTGIRGQLEVALLTARTPEQFREAIVTAMQDVEKLSQITKSLVQLARAESGQTELHKSPEDLVEVAGGVIALFAVAAGERGVRLESSLPASCPVDIDRTQVEQMLHQLLANAINFTPVGGLVSVQLSRQGDELVLCVSDTGPGIGQEHLSKVFERFYRVRSGNGATAGGAGLGLTLASWIAAAHGGRIDVSSAEGRGTTFQVYLPGSIQRGELQPSDQ